ncbi:hypothetical protein BC941DRAFT_449307 [Chlamydoabsidia padenii]|nr:hypothetical protein BC941DRAFT_449307 [Chlamydoabsidia padenii]
MTDNHLFQLAQVISDLSPRSSPTLPPLDHPHDRRILPLRKNACAVCAICFTCSKNYALDCTCEETQPRRGKNLPQNCLDSRAKKLNKTDKEDYDFAIQWLQENAHTIYRDAASNQVVGLANKTEVGLCKAHSSTLYRAKKRWERDIRTSVPSSPHDDIDTPMDLLPINNSNRNTKSSSSSIPKGIKVEIGGGLAAKVKELSQQQQQYQQQPPPSDLNIVPSTSNKRKRVDKKGTLDITPPLPSGLSSKLPHSSASTPLYGTGPLISSHHHPTSISSPPLSYMSPQLPPLQQKQQEQQQPSPVTSLSSLSSSLQQQLHLSNSLSGPPISSSSSSSSSTTSSSLLLQQQQQQEQASIPYHQQGSPTSPVPPLQQPTIQIETVSLKSMPSDEPCIYFIRNLAITDTFTFRHLLDETDITGAPPPGKRIIIADPTSERIFPLGQPIRSVLPRPVSTHMEFCLGLTDKASINWNSYT